MLRTKYKIRFVFKGGAVVDQWFTSFHVSRNADGTISSMQWAAPANNKPMAIVQEELAAVFQIDCKVGILDFLGVGNGE